MKNVSLLLLVAVNAAFGQGTFIFSPSVVPTSDTAMPFLMDTTGGPSVRYQQVYGSSDFSGHGGPAFLITEISFDGGPHSAGFDVLLQNVEIRLSTTAGLPDSLSPVFADNVGVDNALVYSGQLRLSSFETFGFHIQLQQPFRFDPALGNLLLDVRNFQTIEPSPFPGVQRFMAGVNTPGDSVSSIGAFDVNALRATFTDTEGLGTRFTVFSVPEPSLATLCLSALAATGLFRRRFRLNRARGVEVHFKVKGK